MHRGRQIPKIEGEKLAQALHIELNMNNFKNILNKIIAIYRRKTSGFNDRRKMNFFTYPDLVKSDKERGALEKAHKR